MTHGEKPKQPIEQGKPLIKTIAGGILQIRMAQNRPQIWTLLTVGKYPTPNSNSELVDKNPETTDENMEQFFFAKKVQFKVVNYFLQKSSTIDFGLGSKYDSW